MSLKYSVIEVYTSEEARWQKAPVWNAIVDHVRRCGIAARCMVTRGTAGCYENGEVATSSIEILSFNMPVKVDVILPEAELEAVLPGIEQMVTDGIVLVEERSVHVHRTRKRLIPRQLRVKDAMTASPQTVREDTPVSEVIRLLLSHGFNAVPVVDAAGRPVGIITQGDLIARAGMPVRLGLLAQFEARQVEDYLEAIASRKAGEIMTRPVRTVQEDNPLSSAVDLMLKQGLKRLPVVNAEGLLTGILARADVFRVITSAAPDWRAIREQQVAVGNVTTVGGIMRRDTHTVLPDTPIEDVVRVIDTDDIQRVAVVDEQGRFLGMIFDSALFALFSGHQEGLWEHLMRRLPFTEIARKHKELMLRGGARTASDAMETDITTVRETTPTEDAIRLMVEKGIKRLPVVDEQGLFKGMVSRDSVLRAGVGQAQ